ncbi:MAG: cob(I)yrinic acid a,c-diamide adenosyltransferase [Planctomycetaceae bacterium]
MRIYTRTGDGGETGLFGGGRVPKDHPRVEAFGAVDELNAALGAARAVGLPGHLEPLAARIQAELFVLGADLATPPQTSTRADRIVRLRDDAAAALEPEIDRCEEELEPLKTFVLPGGGSAGAALHLARTVCRRAERRVAGLVRANETGPAPLVYLNRLADLLFVMARLANARTGNPETPWRPS